MKEQPKSPLQERIADAFLLLMVTLFLFYWKPQGYLVIADAKWDVFRVLCGGYAALSVLIWAEELIIGSRSVRQLADDCRRSSWSVRLMAVYLLFTLVSALLSEHGDLVWMGGDRHEGAFSIAVYVLCFLLLAQFARPKRWLLYVLCAAMMLESVLCLVQLSGGNPFGLYPEGLSYFDAGTAYNGEFLGTIGNVDFLGTIYALCIPIFWTALLRLRGRWRWLCLPALLLSLLVVWKMMVLSCIVGVVLGSALALPLVLPAGKKARVGTALGLAGLFLAAVVALYLVDLGEGILHQLHAVLHGDKGQNLDSGRLYIWGEVLRLLPKHLWFGAGPDTLARSGIQPFHRFDESLNLMLVARIDAAHNEYLNILYHQGIFSFLAYAAALVLAGVRWLKQCRDNACAAILGAAVLCYAIQAFFNISTCYSSIYFWIVFGLLEGYEKQERRTT